MLAGILASLGNGPTSEERGSAKVSERPLLLIFRGANSIGQETIITIWTALSKAALVSKFSALSRCLKHITLDEEDLAAARVVLAITFTNQDQR